jgi:hypothetical protein
MAATAQSGGYPLEARRAFAIRRKFERQNQLAARKRVQLVLMNRIGSLSVGEILRADAELTRESCCAALNQLVIDGIVEVSEGRYRMAGT